MRVPVLLSVLVLASHVCGAQFNMRGGAPNPGSNAAVLKAALLRQSNPARAALGERKELSLDDTERTRLDSLASILDDRIGARIRVIDTLMNVIRAGGRAPFIVKPLTAKDSARQRSADVAIEKAQGAYRDLQARLIELKDDFDSTAAHSRAALSDAHREKGGVVIDRATRQAAAMLHQASVTGETQSHPRAGGRGNSIRA